MKRPGGLRIRLIAAFTAVAVLTSVLTAGIAYLLVRRAVLQRTQDAVVNEVRSTLEQTVPAQLPSPYGQEVLRPIGQVLVRPGRQVWVVGPRRDWHPFGESYDLRIPASLLRAMQVSGRMMFQRVGWGGKPYLVVGTPLLAARNNGTADTSISVFVVVSLRKEAGDLRQVAWSAAVGGAVAAAVAALLALLAARSVLLPVRRLGRAARELGDGRLDTRVPAHGRDELAELARTFNDTADALQRNVAELRAMEAAAHRFVADVSHELRTPLTAMTAVADTLDEEAAALPESAVTAAGLVAEETRRLRTLVEHLIEVSRFDAGAATLVLDDVDADELVAECLRRRGWEHDVRADLADGVRARLDPRRFDMIVANLVGNALRHGAPPVTVRLWAADQTLMLRVTDHGPGIPAEVRPHVFDRFVKADAARARSDGSGLGLAIARANAERHGGRLDLLDAENTAFELRLPLTSAAEDDECEG
jgi:two-component system sensor histidine kinase MtrB